MLPGKITPETNAPNEALSTSKRSLHDYSRNNNLENAIKKFDSQKVHPRCKVSLNSRLSEPNEAYEYTGVSSSRSSLYSIASIEWDGRCRSENAFRTRSLPRQPTNRPKLYRTQSHSGFINSFIKDPKPTHYHLPRCRSCGTTNASYVWELTKEQKLPTSLYLSVDNIPQKCKEEAKAVKVKEKAVPVFKVAKVHTEFIDSQEFDEDNYLGELGNSFSSDNQTVVDKDDDIDKTLVLQALEVVEPEAELHRAELVTVTVVDEDINNNTVETVEGEYQSFTEDMDFEQAVYESPVKDLVEKDIRDYSVPIDFYCEDYSKKDGSPGKSKQTRRENTNGVLEPILEESKSSYGDESSTLSGNDKVENLTKSDEDIEIQCHDSEIVDNTSNKLPEPAIHELGDKDYRKIEFNTESMIYNVVLDLFSRTVTAVQLKKEMGTSNTDKITTNVLETEIYSRETNIISENRDITKSYVENISHNVETAVNTYDEQDSRDILYSVYENVFDILSIEAISIEEKNETDDKKARSMELSVASSGIEAKSFDSTVEFEKYEIIADLVASILSRIDFGETNVVIKNVPKERNFGAYFDIDNVTSELTNIDIETFDESESKTDESSQELDAIKDIHSENFSIAKIIHDMEHNFNLNDTEITEVSDSDSHAHKIVEAISYYIFDRVFVHVSEKYKLQRQKNKKKVVTVVDSADILYTAFNLWADMDDSVMNSTFAFDNDINGNSDCNRVASIETCLTTDGQEDRVSVDLRSSDNDSNSEIPKEVLCGEMNTTNTENVSYGNSQVETDFTINESCTESSLIINQDLSNFIDQYQNESYETAAEIISEIFELSINDSSTAVENCDTTFVVEKDMNTAFVVDTYSRSSSPHREIAVFEICTESPIKNPNDTFIGDELSVLYEKDDTILGSPFIKKAPVIAMTQTAHSGGIKYWLSFDESLKECIEDKPSFRTARKHENQLPSFFTVDLKDNNEHLSEKDKFKPSSVLFLNQSDKKTESFNSCPSVYTTCDESNIKFDDDKNDEPQKMLLYDSRIDLHAKTTKRQYASWPPYEDTLFYRIISKFRMSESFDPSDLENFQIDNSL